MYRNEGKKMKRKRLKQFLCALLTVSMVAGQPLSLLAAEEAVTEVGAEGFSDAQEAVELSLIHI